MSANDQNQDQELYAAATLLGSDDELTDIAYASPTQAEVMLMSDEPPGAQAPASLSGTPRSF